MHNPYERRTMTMYGPAGEVVVNVEDQGKWSQRGYHSTRPNSDLGMTILSEDEDSEDSEEE
jgi:hypothetical protein